MQPKLVTFRLENDPIEYKLWFDEQWFNHACDAEIATECNVMHAISGGGISARETRALLFAFLKTGHPQVLVEEAGALLSRDLNVVLGALGEIMNHARGLTQEEPAPKSEEPGTE